MFEQNLRKKIMKFAYLYFLFVIHCCYAQTAYLFTSRTDNDKPGFFSAFNSIIAALDFCEQHNAPLGVDFQKEGWYYDTQKGPNWWSYYFDQPRIALHMPIQEVRKFKAWQKIICALQGQYEIGCIRAHELIKRYIRIKKPIQNKIDAFYLKHMDGFYMIGVHYRGTDKTREAPAVSYETVSDIVHSQLQNRPSDIPFKIFIATDDQNFLEHMQKIYGQMICSIDALRSRDNNAVHTNALHTNQELSNYKKGEDALIDCMLLSKCDLLIKMASNLSDTSLMFNPYIPVIRLNKNYDE